MKVQIYPEITVIYFIADVRKEGGKYINISGTIKKIDEFKQVIILNDKTEIPIKDIINISGESL